MKLAEQILFNFLPLYTILFYLFYNKVAYAFERGKVGKCHLMTELARNGQMDR